MSQNHSSQVQLVVLKSGNTRVEISPASGGCISRYCQEIDGQIHDWMRPASTNALQQNDPLEMACFPLIPFSNRIRNGRFDFENKSIQLPLNFPPEKHTIHGHGWRNVWITKEYSEQKAMIEYQHEPDSWPFAYAARQTFELTEEELLVHLEIENNGIESMPAGMGIHPYFKRTPAAFIEAKTEKMWINDADNLPLKLENTMETTQLNEGLKASAVVLDNLFTGWNHEMKITWPESKAQLTMVSESPLDFLVVFTPEGEDFFCVEPVSHATDAFNMNHRSEANNGTRILAAGQSMNAKIRFKPEILEE